MIELLEDVSDELANPETVIIKNKYYPSGLKEKDTYSYYMKNKQLILKQTNDREIMLLIHIGINQPVIRRRTKDGFIKLTSSNYEKIIHGRVVTVYSTMRQQENIGIVDVDFHNFKVAKQATMEVYDYLYEIYNHPKIRFSGKTSFHIIIPFKRRQHIDDIRIVLNKKLQKFSNKYTIGETRSQTKVNLDLSINKFRGAFTTLHALSPIGLRCMEVHRLHMVKFTPHMAKI